MPDFTDVDGVYTADPRVVSKAKSWKYISYEEMLELASSGSKVMQNRAVEFAQKYNVNFEVRSSFNRNPGTIVKEEVNLWKTLLLVEGFDNKQAKLLLVICLISQVLRHSCFNLWRMQM